MSEQKTDVQMVDVTNDMIITEEANQVFSIQDVFAVFERDADRCVSTYDTKSTEFPMIRFEMAGSAEHISEHINEVLDVCDIIVLPCQIRDKDSGEIIESLRIIFITTDGNSYYSTSMGIRGSALELLPILTAKDQKGNRIYTSIKVQPKQINLNNGNRLYKLVPAIK